MQAHPSARLTLYALLLIAISGQQAVSAEPLAAVQEPVSLSSSNTGEHPEAAEQRSGQPPESQDSSARIEHLRQAATHLRAAGRSSLADAVDRIVLLERKLAEMQRAQVKQAPPATADKPATIALHVQMLEIKLDKMRELGVDMALPDGLRTMGATKSRNMETFLTALRKHGLVKVLAEPTIVTVSGRPASFRSGGEIPIVVPAAEGKVAVEFRQIGTTLDCLAVVQEDKQIRLELRAEVATVDPQRSVTIDGQEIPGLRVRMLDTAVEMTNGHTVVINGLQALTTPGQPAVADGKSDKEHVAGTALVAIIRAELPEGR